MLESNIIISDTSCLIILTNIGKFNILKNTFSNILVTPIVKYEYEKKGNVLPEWIKVKEPKDKELVEELRNILDYGESESIVLAKEEDDALLILDDSDARNYAADLGIKVMGTMGVIDKARKKGVVDIDEAVNILSLMKEKGFWVSEKIYNQFIKTMQDDNDKKNIKNMDNKQNNRRR